jgi:hypothetical protein
LRDSNTHPEAFMKKSRQKWLRNKAKKIGRRLKAAKGGRAPRMHGIELSARTIRYETADRIDAIACGGIGAIHQLADRVGLVRALDERLPILKVRRPYSEADRAKSASRSSRYASLDTVRGSQKSVAVGCCDASKMPDRRAR